MVDKNYMAQLVEVQHMRGAQGGDKFTSMLTQDQEPEAGKLHSYDSVLI